MRGVLAGLWILILWAGSDVFASGPTTEDAKAPSPLMRAASLAASCSGCHGAGQKQLTDLDTLDAQVIANKLMTYKAEKEGTTVMHRLARGYSDADIKAVATYLKASREH